MSHTITLSCSKCHNTGVMTTMNGLDDIDQEYCQCPFGENKEMLDDEQIADAIETLINPKCSQWCIKVKTNVHHHWECPKYSDYSNSEREAYGL